MTRAPAASSRTRARFARNAAMWIVARAERIRNEPGFAIRDAGFHEVAAARLPPGRIRRRRSATGSLGSGASFDVAARVAVRRETLELGVLAEERELDDPGRAVALLADDDLR